MSATVPQAQKFLGDCARTSIPGWNEKGAASWLVGAKRQVDALYAEKHLAAVSPMFVSDTAFAVLRKYGSAQEPEGPYDLAVSGGGIAGAS